MATLAFLVSIPRTRISLIRLSSDSRWLHDPQDPTDSQSFGATARGPGPSLDHPALHVFGKLYVRSSLSPVEMYNDGFGLYCTRHQALKGDLYILIFRHSLLAQTIICATVSR